MSRAGSMIHNSKLTTLNYSVHGGNVYRAARDLGVPVGEIIDFSASINPLGIPDRVREAVAADLHLLVHYPDTEASALRMIIAERLGISAESVICGNGSTELIYLIPCALKPSRVLIPAPTFSEYERACRIMNESGVMSYELRKENDFRIEPDEFISEMMKCTNSEFRIQDSKPDNARPAPEASVAFLCNPNNPTGHLLKREEVLKIAAAARQMKCYLVVDEAFIDFVPGESVIRDVHNNPYLIVLRSMTKFYALTGLRAGYGIFHESAAGRIRQCKEPWTVNTLAQKAAEAALGDDQYRAMTYSLISEEKEFLEQGLRSLGLQFYPSPVNYYLLKTDKAHRMVTSLAKTGILVRGCSNFSGLDDSYMRIAVRSRSENERLLREMRKACME